jgi:UDP-N-acetylmuramoyl-tripeptide--D-alanyl-D-alanine ligase
MIACTLEEVVSVVGGRLHGGDPRQRITQVSSDSRSVAPGTLFAALVGERVDGHDFVAAAMEAGAVAVLGTRPTDAPTVVVEDVLDALGKLARHTVDRLTDTTVIGITGSVGKTTAKDLLAAVLSSAGPTIAPAGSFNNELGLPLTVLSADEGTRFLVLEMGARGRGHIAYLCDVAPPSIGVELVVGSAHVGEFGGRAAIADAKAELVRALPADGVAVLNRDDDLVRAMAAETTATVVWFGRTNDADVRADDVTLDDRDRASFTLRTPEESARVSLRLAGEHALPNALAAAAVARAVGMDVSQVAEALSLAEPRSRWRMEVEERDDGLIVINDAYNASPESMRAALKSLKQIAGGRRCWAVLGEMRELGEESAAEHDAIGRLAVRLDVQRLVVVGEGARPMHLAAGLEGSWGQESMFVPDVAAALDVLLEQVRPDDVVLVKASRAVGLEQVAAALLGEGDA